MWKFALIRIAFLIILVCILLSGCSRPSSIQSDDSWRFVIFGDTRDGNGIYNKLACIMVAYEPAFAIHLGDFCRTPGNELEWLNFWAASQPLTSTTTLYLVHGWHEGFDSVSNEIFARETGLPIDTFYYSVERNGFLFLLLDTDARNIITEPQLSWIAKELDAGQAAPEVTEIIPCMHMPLYPQGENPDTLENADKVHDLFKAHSKVHVVFQANDHAFHKFTKDGVLYIETGGAGSPLSQKRGNGYHHFTKVSVYDSPYRVNIQTIGMNNEVIENFDL